MSSSTRSARVRWSLIAGAVTLLASSVIVERNISARDTSQSVLLNVMQDELRRAVALLGKTEPAPYFISYTAYDQEVSTLTASVGALMNSTARQWRSADVIVRVGSPALDNTHGMPNSGFVSDLLPVRDDPTALQHMLWLLTDRAYKRASSAYLSVKANAAVRAEEDDKSPDFSREPTQTDVDLSTPPLDFDRAAWEGRLRRYSAGFREYSGIEVSSVLFESSRVRSSFVSSEGTELTRPSRLARLVIQAETRADDGMDLARGEVLQSISPDRLPGEPEVMKLIRKIASDVQALRAAPVAEPFDGPALLSGEAAAVFFHEVLGHRLEGNRQRSDQEGQTFTRKVNQQILPEFLSLTSDPTLGELNGTALTGAYAFDQEGVRGARVDLIENGVLKNFLMSRMPITNFSHSNGHGRGQPGAMPVARQSNLIVRSSKAIRETELHGRLVDEIRRQGKPYGLYFENMLGGFTLTQRSMPQSFQLLPVMVWRVYPDGRPDELIRGVDVVGTPLAALRNILLTGDTLHVFNGMCGAESGQVPVSAAAPAVLFADIEVQKRSHSRARPPLLPPPGPEPRAEVRP
jgi:TldD protein